VVFLAFITVSPNAFAFDFQVTDSAADCDADCVATNCAPCQNPAAGAPCAWQSALNSAQCNGEPDTLTVAAGIYDATVHSGITDTTCGAIGFCYDGNKHNEIEH